jgi:hypothetical protein
MTYTYSTMDNFKLIHAKLVMIERRHRSTVSPILCNKMTCTTTIKCVGFVYNLYFECNLGGRLGRDRMVLDLQLPMQSVDIATNVVSSYPIQARYTRYNSTHLCIYKYYVFHRQNIFHTIDLVLYFPQLVTVCQCNRSEDLKTVDIESISHC